jgi:hypothetical protein
MTDKPGADADEEPQAERGKKGSRDTGSGKPSSGPADRPSGDRESDTSIKSSESPKPNAPNP